MGESVPEEGISDQVKQFIREHISSVAQLETLLLLHTNPRQAWSSSALARELRIEPAGAKLQLEALCSGGLLRQDPPGADSYQFSPRTPEMGAATALLAQAYLVRRVTVIGLIFGNPSDQLRGFSDAFRLRKDPPRG